MVSGNSSMKGMVVDMEALAHHTFNMQLNVRQTGEI